MIAALLLAAAGPQALTVAEKAAQLQNAAPAEPKLGLPAYDYWSEGLHGIARNGDATVFPQAIAMAATWDAPLLARIGDVVATEARAKFNARPPGADRRMYEGLTIWSPNINIFRDPRWGRGQETYGEDPYLTARLGVAFIRGLQGPDPAHPKVIATAKHFAVHSGPEAGRDGFDVDVSPYDLEATYLPAFRAAIVEGKAGSLMCAYNAIHGTPVCASSALMTDRLRRDWGFAGLTVSDCDAVGNIADYHHAAPDAAGASAMALKAGTDLDCGRTYAALPEAVARGLVGEGAIDTALGHALAARRALGIAPGTTSPWAAIPASDIDTPAHRALALTAAREAMVLLKNDRGLLPLKAGTRIAVIGADADDLGVLQANYHGTARAPVTPLAGLRRLFGAANMSYAQGSVLAEGSPVVVPETALSTGGRPGLRGAYFAGPVAGATPAVATRQDARVDFDYNRAAPFPALEGKPFSVRWTGMLVPPGPGAYRLMVDVPACWKDCPVHDRTRLWIDGASADLHAAKGLGETIISGERPHAIRLELDHVTADEGIRLRWVPPAEPMIAEAVAAARGADVVVAVLGLSPDLEGEALPVSVPGFAGGDRTDIALPAPQRRLLAALRATGKPIVVVLTSGSAVAVDPAQADAILAAWYPGEAGGTAIADTLAGVANPAGRLPLTIYRDTADLPGFADYGMKERTYRYFTGTPLWPFGHGLSYTRFSYAEPAAPTRIAAGESLTVATTVRNIGAREGDEVVQAYWTPLTQRTSGPTDPVLQRQLVGFRRIALKPGAEARIHFTIDPRAMSLVDRDGTRRVIPGDYRLYIGGGQPGDGVGQSIDVRIDGPALDLPK